MNIRNRLLKKGSLTGKIMMLFLVAALLVSLPQSPSLLLDTARAAGEMKPFPQQISYPGIIKPNHVTQSTMNSAVTSYYDYWKGKYLKNNLSSLPGGYYVAGDFTGSSCGYTPLGTSEGQGYGMIITALMAGYDSNAKTIFDGLFLTARTYKSKYNSNLMGWIVADHVNARGACSSATDGDLDIAYSLILAHYQWGSGGSINYLQQATNMINAIKSSNVTTNNRLNRGDWESTSSYSTRPSDWMMSHLRAFYDVTGDNTWLNVIDTLYTAYSQVSTSYSSVTGLIPDFVVNNPAQPASPNFMESAYDGDYYYNAARVPLRIVMDYAMYGESRAKTIVDKISGWIKGKTSNTPSNVKAGYTLSGTALSSSNSGVFTSPFISGATASSSNQAWVNAGWDYMKNAKSSYFSDSYNMLNLLYITGNWWKPVPSSPAPGAALPVTADSYVRGGTYSTTNFNSETTMTVKKNDSNASSVRQSYLKFNKSSVSGAITSAKLRLYVDGIHSDVTSVPMRAFGILNNSWSESSITFANQPSESGVSQGSATAYATPGYIELDVTSFVNSQSNDTVSFRIVGLDHDAGAILATKENSTSSKHPVLLINGGPPTAAPGATLPVTADSFVRGGTYSTINYSTETTMTVKKNDSNASSVRQGYLKFNKSSVSGAITSAKLRLYVDGIHSDVTSVPMRAFGILNNSWSESSITFANQPSESGVSQGSATAYATPGYIELDVTSFVNSQSNDTISFRIVGLDHDAGAILATKENSTSSKRPVLLINGG